MRLATTVVSVLLVAVVAATVVGSDGVSVERDEDVCENMCTANYSDVVVSNG